MTFMISKGQDNPAPHSGRSRKLTYLRFCPGTILILFYKGCSL